MEEATGREGEPPESSALGANAFSEAPHANAPVRLPSPDAKDTKPDYREQRPTASIFRLPALVRGWRRPGAQARRVSFFSQAKKTFIALIASTLVLSGT